MNPVVSDLSVFMCNCLSCCKMTNVTESHWSWIDYMGKCYCILFLWYFPDIWNKSWSLRDFSVHFWFLAMLCATAQQSYCRHVGVCSPSSIRKTFSEHVKHINAKFGGKVPFHHISRAFFLFLFSKFCIFDFLRFFSFSLTWDHMGEKTSNGISSENA